MFWCFYHWNIQDDFSGILLVFISDSQIINFMGRRFTKISLAFFKVLWSFWLFCRCHLYNIFRIHDVTLPQFLCRCLPSVVFWVSNQITITDQLKTTEGTTKLHVVKHTCKESYLRNIVNATVALIKNQTLWHGKF